MDWQMRPKSGIPVVTRGRVQHALAGAAVMVAAGWLGHATGSSWAHGAKWGIPAVFVFAVCWEGLTPWIARKFAPKWSHPYGDFTDMMAYLVGAVVALVVIGFLAMPTRGTL